MAKLSGLLDWNFKRMYVILKAFPVKRKLTIVNIMFVGFFLKCGEGGWKKNRAKVVRTLEIGGQGALAEPPCHKNRRGYGNLK